MKVYHIVNPDTATSWNQILEGLQSAGLRFEKVEAMEWVEKLRHSEPDPGKNPTVKLLVKNSSLALTLGKGILIGL